MFKNLNTGAIGIQKMALPEVVALARETGFAGIDFDIREADALAREIGVDRVRALFDDAGVLPGQWGLPVAWTGQEWAEDLAALPALAELGVSLGCRRTATWCPSWSDERAFDENFAWHVERFRPIAEILAAYECRLGIEFLGPKTLRDGHKHGFIYTLGGMMDLAAAVGTGNVGLLLDVWHLETSGGSPADLDGISSDDIVAVHVNDAPQGVSFDEVIDTRRYLPMETGVLDLAGLMAKLRQLGYDGPVTTEPFNQELRDLAAVAPDAAARKASASLDRLWAAGGIDG